MEEVKMYKCSVCGNTHKDKATTAKCERACKARKKRDQIKKETLAKAVKTITSATSIADLEDKLTEYLRVTTRDTSLIVILDVHFSGNVSNTHSAPKGKPTNWGGRKENVPRSYPGFTGSIVIKSSKGYHDALSASTYSLADVLIHTGTGGARDFGVGYSVDFWGEDFPKLWKKAEAYMKATLGQINYNVARNKIRDQFQQSLSYFVMQHDETQALKSKLEELRARLVKEFKESHDMEEPDIQEVTPEEVKTLKNDLYGAVNRD